MHRQYSRSIQQVKTENKQPSGWCGGADGCTPFVDYLQDNFERLCYELEDPQSDGKTLFPEDWMS